MTTTMASEYGKALFELAHEKGIDKAVFDDFTQALSIINSNSDYLRLLENPRLSATERANAIAQVFSDKIDRYLVNMLMIFAEKRACKALPKCYAEYKKRYCEVNGILAVKAVSAVPLSDTQRERLIEKLSANTGKTILLETQIMPDCIGGIRIEYDGKRADASIKQRLEKLRTTVLET